MGSQLKSSRPSRRRSSRRSCVGDRLRLQLRIARGRCWSAECTLAHRSLSLRGRARSGQACTSSRLRLQGWSGRGMWHSSRSGLRRCIMLLRRRPISSRRGSIKSVLTWLPEACGVKSCLNMVRRLWRLRHRHRQGRRQGPPRRGISPARLRRAPSGEVTSLQMAFTRPLLAHARHPHAPYHCLDHARPPLVKSTPPKNHHAHETDLQGSSARRVIHIPGFGSSG